MLCIMLLSSSVAATALEEARTQEIVVTGERIARSEHETAASVAVVDRAQIDAAAGADRIEQLLQQVPNVQLGSGGEGPTIRGQDSTGAVRDLPAFLSGTRPRTTVTVDGRSISYYELAFWLTSLADVARVEVFRSPQTMTQGRNAIGGAIFVETGAPTFDWQGSLRLTAGTSETREVAAVISGPLVPDQLALRVSVDLRRSRTASQISSTAVNVDPNRDDSDEVRLKLLARPAAFPGISLELALAHGHSQMPQIEGINPPFTARRNPIAGYGIFQITVDSLTGRLTYRLNPSLEARLTVSLGRAAVHRRAPPGLGEADIHARDLSFEPVVSWEPSNSVRLVTGLNYTRSTLAQAISLTAFPPVQGAGEFADAQDSLGLFGEGEVRLLPGLTQPRGCGSSTIGRCATAS